MTFTAIDLFSGVGGLTEGLRQAGFKTKYAFEIDEVASRSYSMNHKGVEVITKDIRKVDTKEIKTALHGEEIHLLAGCPPCQGFSAIRRLNKPNPVADDRNDLINEYVHFIKELTPFTFMMENVPGLTLSPNFEKAVKKLKTIGYIVDYKTVNIKDYGVPQNRKRLVMIGSRLGPIEIAKPSNKKVTVKDKIGNLPPPEESSDKLHKI